MVEPLLDLLRGDPLVPFLTLLAVLLIGLKLGHVIAWPWLFVLLPVYAPILFGLVLFACGASVWAVLGPRRT